MMRAWAALVLVFCALAGVAASAQSFPAFGPRPSADLVVPPFTDAELTTLVATLDRLVGADPSPDAWQQRGPDILWQFARRLQSGRLTSAQEAIVLAHLDRLASRHPTGDEVVRGARRMVTELMVGKKAPEIVGTDLEGRPLKLSDHRNKVVVLAFSAEWCGICKTQIPYERFLVEQYVGWPFALLGVQIGSSPAIAKQAQAAARLSFRAWWDAPAAGGSDGPIGNSWNVLGWPATYVIDGEGTIQFVDLRDEDLLKAVRQLLDAQATRDAANPSRRR
jgi:peroxiredoxin